MKARIDKDGYFISNYTENRIEKDWQMVEQYIGSFIQPMWNGYKWIEGATTQDREEYISSKIASLKSDQFVELQPTDWYIIRKIDTGEPVPEHIRNEREAIRAKYNSLIEKLHNESKEQ